MNILGAIIGAIAGLILGPILASTMGLAAAFMPLPPISLPISLGTWAALLLYLLIVVVLYAIAVISTTLTSTTVGEVTPSDGELFARGALIGLNALMNVFLLPAACAMLTLPWSPFGPALGVAAGLALPLSVIVGPIAGIVGMLAVNPSTANSAEYRVVLAWFGLVMPMAWPIALLGIVVWALNYVGFWTIKKVWTDFSSATLIMHGGWVYWPFPPNPYNLGPFVQIPGFNGLTSPGEWFGSVTFASATALALHESAHNFNVAAFGWWFHVVGFVQENLVPGPGFVWPAGKFAYAELLPEANLRGATNPWLPVWAPPGTPSNVAPTPGQAEFDPATPSIGSPVTLSVAPLPTDADGYVHAIGFLWLLQKPGNSMAAIVAPNSATTTFTPDVTGTYTVTLAATDGADGDFVNMPFGSSFTV